MQGVVRFGARGKLNPRFIGPYEVSEVCVGGLIDLALPNSSEKVLNIFHVSQLKKYFVASTHVLELDATLSYVEQPF